MFRDHSHSLSLWLFCPPAAVGLCCSSSPTGMAVRDIILGVTSTTLPLHQESSVSGSKDSSSKGFSGTLWVQSKQCSVLLANVYLVPLMHRQKESETKKNLLKIKPKSVPGTSSLFLAPGHKPVYRPKLLSVPVSAQSIRTRGSWGTTHTASFKCFCT